VPATVHRELPSVAEVVLDWSNVEVKTETKKKLHDPSKLSVGCALEQWLLGRQRRLQHRWILHNDGSGEIADYLVVEVSTSPVRVKLELWHAKGAQAAPPASASVTYKSFSPKQ
jgi:hypothetical protein